MNPTIRLDPKDNVVVARAAITAGTPVPAEKLTALQDVPAGHKLAARFIAKGEKVLKYNTVIDGEATLHDVGQQIFELILRTASGQKSKSEIVGMGENEFAPWPIGVLA